MLIDFLFMYPFYPLFLTFLVFISLPYICRNHQASGIHRFNLLVQNALKDYYFFTKGKDLTILMRNPESDGQRS